MLSLDKHLFEQRQQLTICWRCSATQCAFDGHVLPLPTLLTHAPMTLLAVLNGMHRDSQGEVVGEGTVWTGCPAKPLGHRQTADFRCAIDENWWCRAPRGSGSDGDASDTRIQIDADGDQEGIQLVSPRSPSSCGGSPRSTQRSPRARRQASIEPVALPPGLV